MKRTTFSRFPIDNASILYLSLVRKDHTNTYRFTMTLSEPICPATLQKAVDRVYKRFPSIISGFHSGFFQYYQVPAESPPQVQSDPGCLITMTKDELKRCAFRVYYSGCDITIEAFHALADGFGAVACFTTLVAQYLRLKYDMTIPVCNPLADLEDSPMPHELEDSYPMHAQGKPLHLPSRYSYQLPGGNSLRDTVRTHTLRLPAQALLNTARSHNTSITTMISAIMASSIMEVQQKNAASGKIKPVRIMVPVDLRRMFRSLSLRNFILYVLPTMEPEDYTKPFPELVNSFSSQMKSQIDKDRFASIMAYNVKTQNSWYFRTIPTSVKSAIMRLAYRYFGESNSSITLTNVGIVHLPEEMKPFVKNVEVTLTPRVRSPYNCAMISYNDFLSIRISRFPEDSELEEIFLRKLNEVLAGEKL